MTVPPGCDENARCVDDDEASIHVLSDDVLVYFERPFKILF